MVGVETIQSTTTNKQRRLHLHQGNEERIALFHEAGKNAAEFPFDPFHK